jgi:hypothetical protein
MPAAKIAARLAAARLLDVEFLLAARQAVTSSLRDEEAPFGVRPRTRRARRAIVAEAGPSERQLARASPDAPRN